MVEEINQVRRSDPKGTYLIGVSFPKMIPEKTKECELQKPIKKINDLGIKKFELVPYNLSIVRVK